MLIGQAKDYLSHCTRFELRDHAFGDREVHWEDDGVEVATGYFGSGSSEVTIGGDKYTGHSAYELVKCGKPPTVSRNDTTGDDEYRGW